AYFVIICVVSAIAEPDFNPISNSCITTLLICLGSGMMGGMIG
ncbi:MAG: TIGR04086 family membrane protein, partial [Bacteroidales bacterium]|nr:TIGR04086 family membrane protein [Bacteroidales bacterium]